MEVEVKDNSKVKKLQGRNVITLHEVKKKEPPAVKPKNEKK
jgi:hypothetical protein